MKNLQIFNYNNTPVSFQMGEGDLMINATQMAKAFGKRPADYLRLPSTNELIRAIVRKSHNSENQLVAKRAGAPEFGGGTWMHEDVAIDFAQWLSVDFRLWCNDRIKELLRFGLTATDEMLTKAATDPNFVAIVIDELTKSRLRTAELQTKQDELARQIEENAPKVAFFDNLQMVKEGFDKKRTYTISKIAHSMGISAGDLNRFLLKKGLAGKLAGNWYIPDQHKESGIAVERTTYTKRWNEETEREEMMPTTYLVWTAKGRELIFSLFEQQ